MHSVFHYGAYHVTRLAAKGVLAYVARVRVLRRAKTGDPGPFILAANHISHFDPPIIAAIMRQKVDWMALAEFFPSPVLGRVLRAIECLPTERDRANRATIRDAIDRLKRGRIIGMFPEGGIRDGIRSVLEGAELRPGVSTLAHIAKVPILPCVILGSDRLYTKANWLPLRRTPVWVAFGQPILPYPDLEKSAARARTEQELAAAFRSLYAELREKFALSSDDLPHAPQQRMSK